MKHLKISIPFDRDVLVGSAAAVAGGGVRGVPALRRKPLSVRLADSVAAPEADPLQIVIACGDLLVAALVLYTLLPPIEGGYLRILGVFMLAFVVAVLTHVPGGYGVFDALIIHFLPAEPGASVVAALLVFRVIYYWVPLLIAGVCWAATS